MEPFTNHRGLIATLDRANVDTDAIIPKQFLKSIKRTGFGESLFFDWRYQQDGSPNPEFELNLPEFSGASILVTKNNFGCGSSREHAVWAVMQYGFRVILAPRKELDGSSIPAFADIFRNNSVKNGLLTIELGEAEVNAIFDAVARFKNVEATIDLDEQRVVLHLDEEEAFHFEIDPVVKKHLLHGLDDIALTLEHIDAIDAFEQNHNVQIPARG
ncbi:MAG: 3-isopropylmalate dehydratase small subunit [Verrucomicrobia bacterium]|nr:3-isopropylmalate dehydratase small subunit [Kiritimatiellia bacterium]MCP5488281.1 3-isopropylmalate dehydratase small subunit [Verrucomicrobiota bacterium]